MTKTRVFSATVCTLLTLGLMGCESISVDSTGAIAPEAAGQLDAFTGTFQGELGIESDHSENWESITSDFEIQISRDGYRPVVISNTDLLGPGCDSKIGKLLTLDVGGLWDATATFEFDSGRCRNVSYGHTVYLYVDRDGHALFSLYKGLEGKNRRDYRADLKKFTP